MILKAKVSELSLNELHQVHGGRPTISPLLSTRNTSSLYARCVREVAKCQAAPQIRSRRRSCRPPCPPGNSRASLASRSSLSPAILKRNNLTLCVALQQLCCGAAYPMRSRLAMWISGPILSRFQVCLRMFKQAFLHCDIKRRRIPPVSAQVPPRHQRPWPRGIGGRPHLVRNFHFRTFTARLAPGKPRPPRAGPSPRRAQCPRAKSARHGS